MRWLLAAVSLRTQTFRGMARWLSVSLALLVIVSFGVVGPPGQPVGAEEGTPKVLRIDADTSAGTIDPKDGGVVMMVLDPRPEREASQVEAIQAIQLRTGRYNTRYNNFDAGNMPECWRSTDPKRFALLDRQIEIGMNAGLDPELVHLQLVYFSPCDVNPYADDNTAAETTGFENLRASRAGYPSFYVPAMYLNPDAVRAMLRDQIRHSYERWGIRTFAVWNEPDALYPMAPNTYLDYYTLVNEELRRVEEDLGADLRIGGPVVSWPNDAYITLLLEHGIRNGLDLDEIVFHRYMKNTTGRTTSQTFSDIVGKAQGLIDEARSRHPETTIDPDIHIDEWGYEATATESTNVDSAGAAFIASSLSAFTQIPDLDAANFFNLQDNWEREEEECTGTANNMVGYGLMDCSGTRRPTYHAFRLFDELGSELVQSGPVWESLEGRQEWGGVATLEGDGKLRVIVRNWDPSRDGKTLTVSFEFSKFAAGCWTSQELGTATDGAVRERAGEDVPTVQLPPNHTMLLTLSPAGSCES